MTAKEIISKKPLSGEDLAVAKANSPKVRAYSKSLEEQGIKVEVIRLTATEVEDDSDNKDSQ